MRRVEALIRESIRPPPKLECPQVSLIPSGRPCHSHNHRPPGHAIRRSNWFLCSLCSVSHTYTATRLAVYKVGVYLEYVTQCSPLLFVHTVNHVSPSGFGRSSIRFPVHWNLRRRQALRVLSTYFLWPRSGPKAALRQQPRPSNRSLFPFA